MAKRASGTLDAWVRSASGTDGDAAEERKRVRASDASWQQHHTVLFKRYGDPKPSAKLAAFDFDDTLVKTRSGRQFAGDASDWTFWHPTAVMTRLTELHEDGFQLVIFSNQKGISSEREKNKGRPGGPKEASILGRFDQFLEKVGLPLQVFLATDDDHYRKPSVAGFRYFAEAHNGGLAGEGAAETTGHQPDKLVSFYCGDAGGRPLGWKLGAKKDFACSDREFALNLGIAFYTPDELFLKEAPCTSFKHNFDPRTVERDLPLFLPSATPLFVSHPELVIMVGYPGSGKSTFVKTYMEPEGYVRVNRDELKSSESCLAAVKRAMQAGQMVVVDNTNPDRVTRKAYIDLAKAHSYPVRVFKLATSRELANHLNYFRMRTTGLRRIPEIAYSTYSSRYQEPSVDEGLQEIKTINWVPAFPSKELEAEFYMFS